MNACFIDRIFADILRRDIVNIAIPAVHGFYDFIIFTKNCEILYSLEYNIYDFDKRTDWLRSVQSHR